MPQDHTTGRQRRTAPGRLALLVVAGGALLGVSGWSLGALAAAVVEVSQKGRAFQPGRIDINRGDTVRFVNDDGDLIHHVQLTADGFAFDSGEQPSGTKTDVRFTKAGSFTVLCGIHPRMKLAVTVR